jgi:hypothetical protein
MNIERLITKQELFHQEAPGWNFELDAEMLLEKALELGFVTEAGKNSDDVEVYKINDDYRGKSL